MAHIALILAVPFLVTQAEASTQDIQDLIGQLGGEDLEARNAAEARLVQLGYRVKPAIRALLKSPDPEIRGRAAQILARMKRRQLESIKLSTLVETKIGSRWSYLTNRAFLSPDGKTLVAELGDYPSHVQVIDVETGNFLRQLENPEIESRTPADSSRPHLLAAGSEGRAVGYGRAQSATGGQGLHILVWDTRTGRIRKRYHTPLGLSHVAVSPDGTRIVMGTHKERDSSILDLESGKVRPLVSEPLVAGTSNAPKALFSRTGKFVSVYWHDGTVRLFDVATARELGRYDWFGDALMAYGPPSPDGRYLVIAAGRGGGFRLLDRETGKTSPRIRMGHSPTWCTFGGSGEELSIRYNTYYIKEIRVSDAMAGDVSGTPVGDYLDSRASLTPDGKSVVRCERDGTIRFWNLLDGRAERVIRRPNVFFRSARFAPGGTRLAVVMSDDAVNVWDVQARRVVTRLVGHENAIEQVVYSNDGKRMVTAAKDGSVRIWDASSGAELLKLEGHQGVVHRVAFSPEERVLVSADMEGRLIVWDPERGHLIRRMDAVSIDEILPHLTERGNVIGFLPGGEYVYMSTYRSAFVWRLDSGAYLGKVYHGMGVTQFTIRPGELAGGDDGEMKRFRIVIVESQPKLQALGNWSHRADARSVSTCALYEEDPTFLAVGSASGHIKLVNLNDGVLALLHKEEQRHLGPFGRLRSVPSTEKHYKQQGVAALGISDDGLTITSFHDDGLLRVWKPSK